MAKSGYLGFEFSNEFAIISHEFFPEVLRVSPKCSFETLLSLEKCPFPPFFICLFYFSITYLPTSQNFGENPLPLSPGHPGGQKVALGKGAEFIRHLLIGQRVFWTPKVGICRPSQREARNGEVMPMPVPEELGHKAVSSG